MRRLLAIAVACGCHHDPPASTATVTLLDPGTEPRRELTYTPRAGRREVRIGMPQMTYVVEWRLDRASPPKYHFQGLDLVEDPPLKGDEGKVVKSIATMSSGDMAADVHGRATAASRAATDTLRDLLGIAIVPFPSAPVGVGARWRVGGRAAPGIQPLDAELDYELVAFDGDTIKIHWSGTVKNASEGVNASIDGTADVRPTDLLPISADFTEKIDLGASFGSAVDGKLAEGIAIKLR